MMFTALPPSVMMPWTRASSRICSRRALSPEEVKMIASSALIPWSGEAAACAARLELVAQSSAGELLGEAQLRMGVDVVAGGEQLIAQSVHGPADRGSALLGHGRHQVGPPWASARVADARPDQQPRPRAVST